MPIETLNDTAVHWMPRLMDELESPKVPFPPVEAYAEDIPGNPMPKDPDMAVVVVRESLVDSTLALLQAVQSFRGPATQEDVRRLSQVRTVVLGALETLKP